MLTDFVTGDVMIVATDRGEERRGSPDLKRKLSATHARGARSRHACDGWTNENLPETRK